MKPLIFFYSLTILFAGACKPATPDHEQADANYILKGNIDVKTARRLINNFESRLCYHPVDKQVGFFESRYAWFSKKQLKSLLDTVKKYGCDGVRFYFAAYDKDKMPSKDYKEEYKDHMTLVMVTTRDSSGKHKDYFGKNENGIETGTIQTADPQNRGEMCPPPQTCIAEGADLLEPEPGPQP